MDTKSGWENNYLKQSEVVTHNTAQDCWLIWNGIVRDLTPLVHIYEGTREVKLILAYAGKDVSHWFDENGEPKTFIHPLINARVPYLPHGPLPMISELFLPNPKWRPVGQPPWWKNPALNVGRLTKNCRPVRIKNVFTNLESTFYVCEEESINRILQRYMRLNSNAKSYTWKYEGRKLDMTKTLTENKVPDMIGKFRELGIADDSYVPCLMLYYNDDLVGH